MNLGAEPKKVVILAGLVLLAGVAWYMNSPGDSSPTPAPRPVAIAPAVTVAPAGSSGLTASGTSRVRSSGQMSSGEFRPRVIGTRPDDRPDPASINPELHLDILAKVQAVPPIEAGRNLFQFGAAPPPPGPMPTVPKGVPPIPINNHPAPPVTAPAVVSANTQPPTPTAPPINLKYYGYQVSKTDGHKVAFLLDGEDVVIVRENETVKQRYRIVRIALNSIEIEDTQFKSTQTLKLQDIPS